MKLSIQLYTLRDLTKDDFAGTVSKLAGMGFVGVELAGYGSCSNAKSTADAIKSAGLVASGMHVPIDPLKNNLKTVIEDANILGCKHVILPWIAHDLQTGAGYAEVAKLLNSAGKSLANAGLHISYHHHSFEFADLGGLCGMDILRDNTDSTLVGFELDVFWLAHGKQDPVSYINKLGKRVKALHLKDMAHGADRKFAPVGSGLLNFPDIIKAARDLSIEWGAVEQDDCYGASPMACVEQSAKYLKSIGM